MANTVQEAYHGELSERYIKGSSLAEGIAGGAGVALAIIGLASIVPNYMVPIATIALGMAFVFEGGAIATRFTRLFSEAAKGRMDVTGLGSGLTAEVIGGITGIILGILTLLKVDAPALLPAAAIVFGGTLIYSSSISARLDQIMIGRMNEEALFREVAHEAVNASSGLQLLLGFSAVTLGILSIVGIASMILNLVALLCVGIANLMSGTAITARVLTAFRPYRQQA